MHRSGFVFLLLYSALLVAQSDTPDISERVLAGIHIGADHVSHEQKLYTSRNQYAIVEHVREHRCHAEETVTLHFLVVHRASFGILAFCVH